jgi:hypothetical protein
MLKYILYHGVLYSVLSIWYQQEYNVPQYIMYHKNGRPGEPVIQTREKKENKNEFVRILSERYCAYVKDSRKNRE